MRRESYNGSPVIFRNIAVIFISYYLKEKEAGGQKNKTQRKERKRNKKAAFDRFFVPIAE